MKKNKANNKRQKENLKGNNQEPPQIEELTGRKIAEQNPGKLSPRK